MTPGRATPAERPEPLYARQVFERLREALDVLLNDDALVAWEDSYIKPNYELRDDGAWLRADVGVDSLNWTPVCDLEESPDSPDPLTTPALPFPFTARQLAAFMLDGWGSFLHQRFASEDGRLDVDVVQALLGGVRDAKPREAIAGAFAALAKASQDVGEPDASLAESQVAATAALDEAKKEAERLHPWREDGITEEERSARVQMRNEMTTQAKAALSAARTAQEKDHTDWRKAMVRWLLDPASRMLPSEANKAVGATPAASATNAIVPTKPVSRARAQENAILGKFKELGVDPMRLPRPKPGKSSPPVARVRAALGPAFTSDVMQKAMARLFEDGRAAYSDTPAE